MLGSDRLVIRDRTGVVQLHDHIWLGYSFSNMYRRRARLFHLWGSSSFPWFSRACSSRCLVLRGAERPELCVVAAPSGLGWWASFVSGSLRMRGGGMRMPSPREIESLSFLLMGGHQLRWVVPGLGPSYASRAHGDVASFGWAATNASSIYGDSYPDVQRASGFLPSLFLSLLSTQGCGCSVMPFSQVVTYTS